MRLRSPRVKMWAVGEILRMALRTSLGKLYRARVLRRSAPPIRRGTLLFRLFPTDQCVGEAAFYMQRIAVFMPGEIILSQALGQIASLRLQFSGNIEPVSAGGNALHAFLIEGVRRDSGAPYAIARFRQEALDAACRMKAEIVTVGAAKHLVDFGVEGAVEGILRLLQDGVEDDEFAAVTQDTQHLPEHTRRIGEVMQAERDECAIKRARRERQRVRVTPALAVSRYCILPAD